MLEQEWEAWSANAVHPDHWRSVDPGKPWTSSPGHQLFALPPEIVHCVEQRVVPDGQLSDTWRADGHNGHHPPRRRASRRISSWIDKLAKKRRSEEAEWPVSLDCNRIVTPEEWKAYGNWARPKIRDVVVRNATPPTVSRNLNQRQVESLMHSLKSADGSEEYPERWIARVQHPSLPPRPPLWPTPPSSPRPNVPQPSETQLNPFLQHRMTGKPPLVFDIRLDERAICLGDVPPIPQDPQPGYIHFHLDGPNGAQPATYPGMSALSITALADDPLARFPWPFTVVSHHPSLPITVRDVLYSIRENFDAHMTPEEVESLAPKWRDRLYERYYERVEAKGLSREDGVRRVDYLGDRCMFRGLGPAADGEGFIMFVGPSWF